MLGISIKLFVVALGIIAIFYCAASVFRNSRKLQQRMDEFREEQDTYDKKHGARNPYAALAELYQEEENERLKKRR